VELTVMVHEAYTDRYGSFVADLFARWRAAGFGLTVLVGAFELADAAWKRQEVDLGLDRWFADYPDPDTFIYPLLHTAGGHDGDLCGAPDLDQLIEEARVEPEPRVRDRLYRRIEELAAERALCLPLFHEHTYCHARPEVRGFSVGLGDPPVPFEEVWLIG
jgi:ABC-type oligopeptide transport system substrate-binding subunit